MSYAMDEETNSVDEIELFSPLKRLDRDLIKAARSLGVLEARYLVGQYYRHQEERKRSEMQTDRLAKAGGPNTVIEFFSAQARALENQVKRALDPYSTETMLGQWSRSIVGIGPVLAAGLLAHLDDGRERSVSEVWSFAGLNPSAVWGKGEKRPWNARLKVLCWKIGESFKKTSGRDDDFYGQFYKQRKVLEVQRNEAGLFADQAAAILKAKTFDKTTIAYQAYVKGKLPPAHLDMRATRYATKIFLCHWRIVQYRIAIGDPTARVPSAWITGPGGHQGEIEVPNWPMPE